MNQKNYLTDVQIQKLKQIISQKFLPFYTTLQQQKQTISDIEHEHFLQQTIPDFIGFMRQTTYSGTPAWFFLAESDCWQTMRLIEPFLQNRAETAQYFLWLENSCTMCPNWLTKEELAEKIQTYYFHVSPSNMNYFIEHYPELMEPTITHIANNLSNSLKNYRPYEDIEGESIYQLSGFNALFNAAYTKNQNPLPIEQVSHALVGGLFIFQELKHNELRFFSDTLLKNIYQCALSKENFNALFLNMDNSSNNNNEELLLNILHTHELLEYKEQIYQTCSSDLRLFGLVTGYFEKSDLMHFCKKPELAKEMYAYILNDNLPLKATDLKRKSKI